MAGAPRCPDPKQLQQLLLGHLSDETAERLEQHVEQCDRCSRLLPSLQRDDALVEAMRARARVELPPAEVKTVRGLISRLHQMRTIASAHVSGAHSQGDAPPMSTNLGSLAFLSPAKAPGEMGRLGPYRVLKVLGQGGMGVVFLAEDPQLQRTVALKAMLPEAAKRPGAKERFLREARATAKIEHDHIVTIYQVGQDRDVPYLAMQLLKGMSLEDFLKKKQGGKTGMPFTLDQVLKLGRELAKGLAAAHERGLIHRDIKPANIWLDSSAGGRVKILDFGLVRADEDDKPLTQIGTIVGTVAYMAPEQARGVRIDARADLFSLGCVLYRLCSGRLPFHGKDAMETLISVSTEEPMPVQDLNPQLPMKLSRLIMKLLAKKPEDRPASAKAVVEAIQAIETSLPTMQVTLPSVVLVPVAAPQPVAAQPAAQASVWQDPAQPTAALVRLPTRRRKSRLRPLAVLAIIVGVMGLVFAAALSHMRGSGEDSSQAKAEKTDSHAAKGSAAGVHSSKAKEPKDTRAREPEPKKDPEPKKEPEPKKDPEPKKEPEPKKDPEPRPKEPLDTRPPDSVKYVTNSIGMKLAPVAAGEFLMGTSAADFQRFKQQPSGYYGGMNGPDAMEGPQHRVKISRNFLLGAYLVTQAQYQQVMGTNPSWFSANGKDKDKVASLDTSQFPVDSTNWFDAVAFCKKLSELPDERKAGRVYRLPTEAEWEYACRAGTTTTTPFGNTLSARQANIDGDHPLGNTEKAPKIGRTVNVGSYPPNAWGLYDMQGNLWQWCLDGPRAFTAQAVTDPRGPDTTLDQRTNQQAPTRILRGGCWRDGGVSASFRKPRQPELYRIHIVGFRVLCER
jgi:serine/threonine protein kinase